MQRKRHNLGRFSLQAANLARVERVELAAPSPAADLAVARQFYAHKAWQQAHAAFARAQLIQPLAREDQRFHRVPPTP